MTTHVRQSVAQYLTYHINNSDKTQRQIALEIGYTKANIITMFKQGLTKLPLEKIGPLAKGLEIAPDELFYKVMKSICRRRLRLYRPSCAGNWYRKKSLSYLIISTPLSGLY